MSIPRVIVEIGFGGAGNTDYLLFNDTARGKFNTGKFAGSVFFTDVSADVYDVTWDRGRQRPLESFKPGRCTITLDNVSGKYDPNNLSGPYVTTGVTQVLPMCPVRVRVVGPSTATVFDVFYGYADAWVQEPRGVQTARTVLTCTDGFKVLAAYEPGGASPAANAGDDTGTRIGRILDLAGWAATDRDLDTGDSTLQASTYEGNALTQINDAVVSEQGYFFMAPNGKATFRNRTSRYESVFAVLSAAGYIPFSNSSLAAGLAFESVEPAYDDDLIKNAITATIVGGTAQTTSSSASIGTYLTKSHNVSNLQLQTDGAAANWANQILVQAKNAEQRIDSVALMPVVTATAAQWEQLLGLDFGDVAQTTYVPVAGDALDVYSFIDGMKYTVRNGVDWTVELSMTPTTAFFNAIVFTVGDEVWASGPPPGFNTFQFTF